jgi:molecular chaperone DnaK
LIYGTEKTLTDNADKLDEATKSAVEKAIAEAKEVKDGDDFDLITEKKEALSQASMKVGQAIYGQQQGRASEEEPKSDDTVDADFTEKKDEQKDDKDKK